MFSQYYASFVWPGVLAFLLALLPALAHADAPLRLNVGGSTVTANGVTFSPDAYFSGTSSTFTTGAVSTAGVANAAPAAVYQAQRQSGLASAFTYTLPGFTPNASYLVRLHFAETYYTAAGKRQFNIAINGTTVATNFDVFAQAGSAFLALVKDYGTAANSSGNIVLTFTGVKDKAILAGIEALTPVSAYAADVPAPAWAEDVIPTDSSGTKGLGPSSADSVNLASGVYENRPDFDILADNPFGPNAIYNRMYRSSRALQGYGSPGLPVGWMDNYDLVVTAQTPGAWGVLALAYPNGAGENWTPTLNSGVPSGALTPPSGTPYVVSGQPSTTTGLWTSLTLTNPGLIRWTFSPDTDNPNRYRLSRIANRVGRSIVINRDASHRLVSITDDSATPQTLLSFAYAAGSITITDPVALRAVQLTIGTSGSTPVLSAASQVSTSGGPYTALWQYSYTLSGSSPLLTQVGIVDPNGSGTAINHQIGYNSNRVSQITDANNNTRTYTPNGSSTSVAVRDSLNNLVLQWAQKIGVLNETAGTTDAKAKSSGVAFTDPVNPYRPTSVTNRNSQALTYTYDTFGNVLTETETINGSPLTTTYLYRYDLDPQGLLTSAQEGNRTATTLDYYDGTTSVTDPLGSGTVIVQPRGLLKSISTPKPGTTGGPTVTTTYAYTALGNVWFQTDPAPNSGTGVVITRYRYTSDPDTGVGTVPERAGMPLSMEVFDPNKVRLSHIHYFYDSAGRRTKLTDALGNVTAYSYNAANQVLRVTYPATGQTGPGQSHVDTTYAYTGGPALSMTLFDESGNLKQTTNLSQGKEGEAKSQTTGGISSAPKLDAQYRPTGIVDGNNVTAKQYGYDIAGNPTTKTYPDGFGLTLTPDNDGNTLGRLDGVGTTTTYTRASDDNRLTDVTYSDGVTPAVHLDYDAYDRVTHMHDGTGDTYTTYDDLDNVTSEKTVYTALPAAHNTFVVRYTYNTDGTRASMDVQDGAGNEAVGTRPYSYVYDACRRCTDVFCPWVSGGHYTYTYQANGLLTKQHSPRADMVYTYNAQGQITSLHNDSTLFTNPVSPLSRWDSILYDAWGNHTQMQATIPAYGSAPDLSGTLRYWFDPLSRLTRDSMQFATYPPSVQYDNTYNYDGANNPILAHGRSATFNTSNQDTTNTYNHNGDPTTYQSRTVVYDAEHRVTSIPGSVTYGYKGDDLRAWKQNTTGGAKVFYLYDDDDHAIGEVDGSSGLITRAYGFGPNGLVQRYYADLQKYTTYCWDVNGNLANRARSNDLTVLTDSTPLYDGFGQLYLDADTQSGGIYPPVDPIGAGGQFGHLTDEELRGNGSQTGLRLLGRNLYDGSKGHFLARAQGGFNEYDAAQLPYQVFTGIAKGIANAAWSNTVADVPLIALSMSLAEANNPQAAPVIERFRNPWAVGDSRAERASAVFGGFATEATGAFFAGTGAIRGAGEALKETVHFTPRKETFITYAFKKDGQVVYIGKARGVGTPEQVLDERIWKGHRHWKPDEYTKHVIDVQNSEEACAGAEGVWFEYHKTFGSKLTNKNVPLAFRDKARRLRSIQNLEAYNAELQQR